MNPRTSMGGRAFRVVLGVVFALFFLFPLYAMADFSTRNLLGSGRTLAAWKNLVDRRRAVQRRSWCRCCSRFSPWS